MISATLIEKIEQLSPELQKKIELEVDALLSGNNAVPDDDFSVKEPNIGRGYGIMKDKIWTSDDFDEPLEDFRDYM